MPTGFVRRMTRVLGAAAAASTLVLVAGCTSGGDDSSEAPKALEKVTYLTGAGVQGREAYIYVASEKGYFRDAGLDVEVKPGNGTEQNLKLLQGGQADFATVDITAALIEYASAIAGGCTSGLALSGGIALAPGAFIFMAAMFATGIPTAWLVWRKR